MKISTFATDLDLEEKGVWVDIGDGGKLLIARLGNPRYQEAVRRLSKPHKTQIRNKTISEDLSDELLLKAMAESILLDWKGLEDDKGKVIKYSTETAFQLLRDLRDFRNLVVELATEQAAFRREETAQEGNA
ncbi:MAG: hypothetical protein OEQ39_12615 [Gammaproteobacteria bacterium]|nr:hypothetical protein [Gammaproteobacteria bacterium]